MIYIKRQNHVYSFSRIFQPALLPKLSKVYNSAYFVKTILSMKSVKMCVVIIMFPYFYLKKYLILFYILLTFLVYIFLMLLALIQCMQFATIKSEIYNDFHISLNKLD